MVKSSKDDLVKEGGYDLIVIEDFYDCFLGQLEKLAKVDTKDAVSHTMKVLCNHEEANYIIMYSRFMAATYLKKNAIMFEDFVGDVA
jgi:Peptidase C65 Otubain